MSSPFFILTCARSGSTSLSNILDLATNGCCQCEPSPNLNKETRLAMDGKISADEKKQIINGLILPRVKENEMEIYGEKNLTFGPFIEEMFTSLNCNFVFLIRDGRDVVTSLMNWHNQMFGSIYRECQFVGDLDPNALSAAGNLPVHLDMSDYSRPRPLPGNALYDEWENLTREEMCTYYWSYINGLYSENLKKISPKSWKQVNYTDISTDIIIELADFLKLKGLDKYKIELMLKSRINSVKERCGEEKKYSHWHNWDSGQRRRFNRIAKKCMFDFGFYRNIKTMWKPKKYNEIKNYVHNSPGISKFQTWLISQDNITNIASIGIELNDKQHNINTIFFESSDVFIENQSIEKYDAVFAYQTINHSYDIDQYLQIMVEKAEKWIILTYLEQWPTEPKEHQYSFNNQNGSYKNRISPSRIRTTLENYGCYNIIIEPLNMNDSEFKYEIYITAKVNK